MSVDPPVCTGFTHAPLVLGGSERLDWWFETKFGCEGKLPGGFAPARLFIFISNPNADKLRRAAKSPPALSGWWALL